jgi:hypothetical protein
MEPQKNFSTNFSIKTPINSKHSDPIFGTDNPLTNCTPIMRSRTNEYVLEYADSLQSIKYQDSSDDFNTDYTIEISQEEIFNRLYNETDEDMKIFCKNK